LKVRYSLAIKTSYKIKKWSKQSKANIKQWQNHQRSFTKRIGKEIIHVDYITPQSLSLRLLKKALATIHEYSALGRHT
jgi:ribosomal protein S25